MRIASRPFARAGGSAQATFLMTLGVLVLGWMATGCDDKHIGRSCETNADAGTTGASGGGVAIVSSPVLACPSRICLLPADMHNATSLGDGAFCTAPCSTDDDCADGETTSTAGDPHCKTNFVCMIPTTVGPFCCQKFCVCHDFVIRPDQGFTTPEACMPSSTSCQNVPH